MKTDREEIQNGGGKSKKIIKFAVLGLIFANLFMWLAVFAYAARDSADVWDQVRE